MGRNLAGVLRDFSVPCWHKATAGCPSFLGTLQSDCHCHSQLDRNTQCLPGSFLSFCKMREFPQSCRVNEILYVEGRGNRKTAHKGEVWGRDVTFWLAQRQKAKALG